MEDPLTRRRRFLQGAGVGGAALLAGCSGILDSDDTDDELADPDDTLADPDDEDDAMEDDGDDAMEGDDGEDPTGEDDADDGIEPGEGDTREIGIVSEPDEEAMIDLQVKIQEGEIEQEEAMEEQQQIIEDGMNTLIDILERDTSIEVTEEFPEFGAVRAEGDPVELVDTLTSVRTAALIPPREFDAAAQPP